MQSVRPLFAPDPKVFGRGPMRDLAEPARHSKPLDDIKLFAATFLAGFLFVTILIG